MFKPTHRLTPSTYAMLILSIAGLIFAMWVAFFL